MSKRGWLVAWAGLGLLFACGEQAVDYPNGSGDGGAGLGTGSPCSKDSDCRGICQNGTCAACATSAQCKDPTKPVCDPSTGACGGCTSASQCPDNLACVGGQCTTCTNNSQCAAGQACVNGKCGPCTSNTQCNGAAGEQCINGACTSGGDGGPVGPTLDSGTDACAAGYVGNVGPVGSVWGNATAATPAGFGAAAGGKVGKLAGDNACSLAYAGSHACTWEEVKLSDTCGKLTALKNTATSAWMHRTAAQAAGAPNTVDDGLPQPGAPAPGGRCNDWTYPTNHAFDGEWIEFGGGVMHGHLDGDTADDGPNPPGGGSAHAAAGVLQCNGESRLVLCCK